MAFIPKRVWRLWFFVLESIVIGIPGLMLFTEKRSLFPHLIEAVYLFAWPALLITSIVLTRFDRRLAYTGFVSCFFGGVVTVLPVIHY